LDDTTRQALLSRFEAYLDTAEAEPQPLDEGGETADLYSVFVELAGLRTEVRTESRLVKDALDQFRAVFEALQTSHATVQQELDRARSAAREQANAALRPVLLDLIDLRDRLVAALKLVAPAPRTSWFRRPAPTTTGDETWQEGQRMSLRRLDQILLDRRVTPIAMLGQPFDPRRARVVATAIDAARPEGTVIEEVRAGFLWEDQVLRIADVIVTKKGEQS